MNHKKLTIVVPIYNTENYLRKCLDSVLEQTYKNLEVILVNDCSTDNSQSIIDEYCKKDNRFKCVNNPKNLGLFKARLAGAKEATGDYIAFLDSDDYVTIDFYRTMMYNIIRNDSDMVLGNTILEFDDGKRIIFGVSDMNFEVLEGKKLLNAYFEQRGLNFSWHTIWNKIYKMSLWKKAVKHYLKMEKHLIMAEDFAFSTVLFYYAKSMTHVLNDGLFYCKHEKTASTSIAGLTSKKMLKNIEDLITSFDFVESFMKEVNIYDTYKDNFLYWKKLYRSQQEHFLEIVNFNDEEVIGINEKLEKFCDESIERVDSDYYFSSIQTKWNNGYEELKRLICNPEIEYVSFDIFDTLIVRPFLTPTDLFILLDKDFRELSKNCTGVDFSKMRINAEKQARDNLKNNLSSNEEITLDDIYNVLVRDYNVPENITDKMKKLEIDAEIRFCMQRKSAYELYEMALSLGKKIICTSDMYLPKSVIIEILKKNGYTEIEEIYLSSEIMLTKSTGNLYTYIKKKLGTCRIIHIGDNYESDVLMARNHELQSIHFRKATDIFFDKNITNNLGQLFLHDLPDWQDNLASMQFLGIRTMIAVVANKYFDNPYRSFNKDTDFNADPYFMGYYALGMHLYGVTKWLLDFVSQDHYDNIVFMARDGYLPMKAYQLMRELYNSAPKGNYLYISRKASIPFLIRDEHDVYKLSEIISWYDNTPKNILKYVRTIFNIDNSKLEQICKEEKINIDGKFTSETEFYKFISILTNSFFDKENHSRKLKLLKQYFDKYFVGKSCVFDVGYSARPELYLSKLCEKEIDTYFININHEEALKHAMLGNFKLRTFYDYKPKFTGLLREILFSKCAPSCVEYKIENDTVTEVFDDHFQTYQEKNLINMIQNAALDFIRDMISIFDYDLDRLYYQNYYISMPYEMLLQSARYLDRMVMSAIVFEDDIRISKSVSVAEQWSKEISWHNQYSLEDLFTINDRHPIFSGVDLSNRSKFIKLIYYVFIDRIPLKQKVKEKLENHKMVYSISNGGYKLLRKAKNTCYKIIIKKR